MMTWIGRELRTPENVRPWLELMPELQANEY